jgi:ferredoxin-type protein NapF
MQLITEEFQLLGSLFSTRNTHRRPPWAIADQSFIQTCNHCGECIHACPEHILIYGRGDYPEVDFSKGGCTFCGKCSQICEPGGLRPPDENPWQLKAFIANTCLTNSGTDCTACSESCPNKAISFRPQVGNTSVPILEEMLCNGCGTCVSACPASAIHVYSLV